MILDENDKKRLQVALDILFCEDDSIPLNKEQINALQIKDIPPDLLGTPSVAKLKKISKKILFEIITKTGE